MGEVGGIGKDGSDVVCLFMGVGVFEVKVCGGGDVFGIVDCDVSWYVVCV